MHQRPPRASALRTSFGSYHERLKSDLVAIGANVLKACRTQQVVHFGSSSVMSMQLRQFSREIVADTIAAHGRGDEASPGSQGAVALVIEIEKHVVVEKFAEAERNDGIHIA